jgi:hypothetical protein
VIAAVVVAMVVLVPILLAAVMYVMVMGVGTGQSPSAGLMSKGVSGNVLTIGVSRVSYEVELANVWIDPQAPQGHSGVNAGHRLSSTSDLSLMGADHHWITYHDRDSDRMLSTGDPIAITSMSGPLDGGMYAMGLMYLSTGATMARIDAIAT